MFITRTVTKKVLERIVHETFANFGTLSCSSLLDSLKLLGFYYATNGGISINIEDLKTPDVKREFLNIANEEVSSISEEWQQGFVSDTERFQRIIDSWNIATESLKNRIVDYYENFDPANNLYIMAFSGARGNMSQVRQLVGMRGLMSDQEGKIIDLPIQANFREGLSSIDYIVSSYGARKGIVDTALKTADSGYLTRRLIYIAQDLVIRETDCLTNRGIVVLLNKKTTVKNILGQLLLSAKQSHFPYKNIDKKTTKNLILNEKNISDLKKLAPLTLNIRSPLTCELNSSICQNCYGWDLAHDKLISLGEAVGIIAAQSIGEPGTQLTMRTFHTGGIFTSETLKQIKAPFSGKILIPNSLKTTSYRTTHGVLVSKLQQEAIITMVNWKGIIKEIFLEIGSFLYVSESCFLKKDQLVAEYSTQSILPGARKLKPIYTNISGEIRFENLLVRKTLREQKQKNPFSPPRTIKINQDDGILWIGSGKIFSLPSEIKYKFPKKLKKNDSIAYLNIITPYEGVVFFENQQLIIQSYKKTIKISLESLKQKFINCNLKYSFNFKNYQYVDKYTILGSLEIFSQINGKIYSLMKKETADIINLFTITENDVWKINSEQVNDFNFNLEKKGIIRTGYSFDSTLKSSKSGFFLKKDGFKMVFQNAIPIFLSRGTILNYKQGDFVLENELFATLVNYTQQTEDIVQGLPKIEELIEARRPKNKAFLSNLPGVLLKPGYSSDDSSFESSKDNSFIFKCNLSEEVFLNKPKRLRQKQLIPIAHDIVMNKSEIFFYNGKIVKVTPLDNQFDVILRDTKTSKKNLEFVFINKNIREKDNRLFINGKVASLVWLEADMNENSNCIYKFSGNKLVVWNQLLPNFAFKNLKNSFNCLIVKNLENKLFLLEYVTPIIDYPLSLNSKVIIKPGNFVDIGEPITEGIIDIHELLSIFFNYHNDLDGLSLGVIKSLNKFQLLLVNSIQSIYQSQGVGISSKHIEIISRQMTAKVVIKDGGTSPYLPGELIRLSLILEIYKSLKEFDNKNLERQHSKKIEFSYKLPKFEPLLLSTTNSCLNKDGFLSAAGFQETKRVLTKAAIEGTSDWLRGLKECIIIGRLIPAGSAFLNYKNYLDNIYLFKN